MINSRLSIYRPAPFYEWVDVPLSQEVQTVLEYAIADIREPDQRHAAFSKTLNIPGTKEVNAAFELIFDINISLQNFNPNLKTKAQYFIGNDRIFNGNLQILSATKKYIGEHLQVIYECAIIGEANDLIVGFGDKYLHDINFSGGFNIDHVLTFGAQTTNQPAYLGEGYCYPWIKYGISGDSDMTWKFENLKPAIFERFYLRKMFYDAGKTWTSTFLDSTYYKSIIIPTTIEGNLKADATTLANAQFYAGKTADTTNTIAGTAVGAGGMWTFGAAWVNFAQTAFNDDSTGVFFDPGGVYDTGTNLFTANYQNYYHIVVKLDFEIKIIPPAGTATYTITNTNYNFKAEVWRNGSGIASNNSLVAPNITTYTTFSIYITIPSYQLFPGNTIQTQLFGNEATQFQTNFKDGYGANINTGTASLDIKQKSTSVFYALVTNEDLQWGGTVVMNDTIPRNIKQRDFFMSIVHRENLYIEQDKNDPNNYIIEPRDTFIQYTNPLEWTYKLDTSKDMVVVPMGDLNFKNLIYSYKSDKDYFNQQYENVYKETFSTKRLTVANEFIKNEKKTELIFSATPVADNNYNDIICPKIYQADVGQVNIKPMASNIRCLIWKGATACQPYTLYAQNSPNTVTSYNFAGMMDDPLAPTVTLDWAIPQDQYYYYPAQTYTDNNLYNRNYSKFIAEITDKDSKIVKAYFNLNSVDIATFSFRKIIHCDGTYYFVNKIVDYNPIERRTTLVELLKLKKGITFGPVSFDIEFVLGNAEQPAGNFGEVMGGMNNRNMGNNCIIIGGQDNWIG